MTKKSNAGIIALAGALTTLGPFTVDPYLPSFPAIAEQLNTDLATVQLSVSAITLGFTIGTIIAGPISDAYGRRKPLLYSLVGYLVVTIWLALSSDVPSFFAAKIAQGIFGAALFTVAIAVIRDLYSGLNLIKAMGQMFLVAAAAWVIAPTTGSLALSFADWRGLALLIAAFAALQFLFSLKALPETRQLDARQKVEFASVFKGFRKVLRDRSFTGLVIISMVLSISQFGYIVVFPTVIHQVFNVPAGQVGLYFAVNSMAAYAGIQFSSWFARKVPPQWALAGAMAFGLAVGAALIIAANLQANLIAVALITLSWLFAFGFQFTLIQALALAHHGEEAGTASGLMSSAGYIATTLAGPYFTTLDAGSSFGYGSNILVFMGIGLVVYLVVVRPWAMRDLK